ncbi:MAG TPA: PilX N-terminal domain-containing pilus assembly protein [Rhodanobacteraceae bacterium]
MNRIRPRGNAPHRIGQSMSGSHAQRGVALVVALILLIVITLIGLAAVSGTIMQSKMAANQYDRQEAFQNAASALQVAQQRLLSHPDEVGLNCQGGGVVCLPNPFTDPNFPADKIFPVPAGTAAGEYTAGVRTTGQPEYAIESLGHWIDPTSNTGFNQTANAKQYGSQGTSSTATYYRITARSGDPAKIGDRAIVTLQAVIKQD